MAVEATQCQYCRRGIPRKHAQGCPVVAGANPTALKEWEKGFRVGWADEHIAWYLLRDHYSPAFRLGYNLGKAEIDALVDDAAQSRICW